MTTPRKIAVITTSRAEYGHLFWPMREIDSAPDLDLQLIVAGAHLHDTFGQTADLIEADGFSISARLECLDPEDSGAGMANTIGNLTSGLTPILTQLQPDILLIIADRYEMLAPASAALAMRIPIAHIEGGDISEGAVDDAVRNALTKMAHLHFTPTREARERVLAMGEESWRVTVAGAPSLDHLRRSALPSRAIIAERIGGLSPPLAIVALHPVTLENDTVADADATLRALEDFAGQLVFCFPNADDGYSRIANATRAFCNHHPNARLFVNLDHLTYWALLGAADVMIGNSSSGIMETASLALPTVDVGRRQAGRTRARNVIHAPAQADTIRTAIRRALSQDFIDTLAGMTNPYGDGHASECVVSGLVAAPNRQTLLHKRALPLAPATAGGGWLRGPLDF